MQGRMGVEEARQVIERVGGKVLRVDAGTDEAEKEWPGMVEVGEAGLGEQLLQVWVPVGAWCDSVCQASGALTWWWLYDGGAATGLAGRH